MSFSKYIQYLTDTAWQSIENTLRNSVACIYWLIILCILIVTIRLLISVFFH